MCLCALALQVFTLLLVCQGSYHMLQFFIQPCHDGDPRCARKCSPLVLYMYSTSPEPEVSLASTCLSHTQHLPPKFSAVSGVFLSSPLDPANLSRSRHFNVSLSLVFRPTFSTPLLSKGSKTHCSWLVLAPHRSNLLSVFFRKRCTRFLNDWCMYSYP